jgi:hypothetical protein
VSKKLNIELIADEQFNFRIPLALKQRMSKTKERAARLKVNYDNALRPYLLESLEEFDRDFNAVLDEKEHEASAALATSPKPTNGNSLDKEPA